jgi:hypothetical protein
MLLRIALLFSEGASKVFRVDSRPLTQKVSSGLPDDNTAFLTVTPRLLVLYVIT